MTNKFKENISLFKNTFDKNPSIATLGSILEKCKTSSELQYLCAQLQKIKDREERQIFKQVNFPAIATSGTFRNGHAQKQLIQHSGLVQMDFDEKDFPTSLFLDDIQELFRNDPYSYAGFTSPSGTGYKVLVQIEPDPSKHLLHFLALHKYYKTKYGLICDQNCKDIGRLCFLSYDPFIHCNQDATVFCIPKDITSERVSKIAHPLTSDLELQILGLVLQIEQEGVDITDNYQGEWLKIGFALSDALGEEGRIYFHRISALSKKYNPTQADKQYSACLKSRRAGITINSLFYIAKRYGLNIDPDFLLNIERHEKENK
jgi:hypothetical protein